MNNWIHPAFIFIIGALIVPLIRNRRIKQVVLVLIPLLAFLDVSFMKFGDYGRLSYLGFNLHLGHVDKLSILFAHVFTLIATIGSIYGLHVKEDGHHVAAYLYVAGSLGVTFAGDYLTLFIFWELMAFSSVFLVWYRRSSRSIKAGFRYLLVHTTGGLILLAGIILHYKATNSLAFGHFSPHGATLPVYLIMIGFALNAAVPPIHAWLPDAYPEATVAGAVFMSAFTTKTAVYVLARAFAGFHILAIMGAIMAVYGVCYAVIENDARRILAYHIVSQVGYMVCGIGIGTEMAVNGAGAHAYAHIIYKALLFMGAGAVLEMTGRSKLSELGGLWRYMPLTMIFTIVGGISISGFPLTSGFVSKSMTVAAAGEAHQLFPYIMLNLASVGTFLSVGLKLPYFIWFGKEKSDIRPKEAPLNMQIAMGIASFLCFMIGIYPHYLFRLLPFTVEWEPYTPYHLSEMLQVLFFTGLGFFLLLKKLTPEPKLNLDIDWFYRKGIIPFMWIADKVIAYLDSRFGEAYRTIGLKGLIGMAKGCSTFDIKAIDGVVDGTAYSIKNGSNKLREVQTGHIQQYIAIAALVLILILLFTVAGEYGG